MKSTKSLKRSNQTSKDRMPGRAVDSLRKHRSYVFYGRSGTGKTTLASTFPTPILLLDIKDEGTDSISDLMDKGKVEAREIATFDEFEDMYWWLKDHPKEFATVVIDTASQLQQLIMLELGEGKKKKDRQIGDWGSMTKRDWGDVAALLKEWFINYRDLTKDGMEVVFIAQDRIFNFDEDNDSAAGEIDPEVGPQLMPSVAKVLNASVSMIGNTFIRIKPKMKEVRGKKKRIDETRYCLRIGPSAAYVTKVRKPRGVEAPAFIEDPTYEAILDIIKGE